MIALLFDLLRFLLGSIGVPILLLAIGVSKLSKALASVFYVYMRRIYYPALLRKRRANGEPEWQKHDLMLGVVPPNDHGFWNEAKIIGDPVTVGFVSPDWESRRGPGSFIQLPAGLYRQPDGTIITEPPE